MKAFAAYLNQKQKSSVIKAGRDLFRGLEEMTFREGLNSTQAGLPSYSSVWYSETEFCYMKNQAGFFFAGKGGYNAESHNHNDIGTFSLYFNKVPVFIDAGVGTYTRQTFSNERYTIWTMQSNFHNLPMINGSPQIFGKEYRSKAASFDDKSGKFSLDIAGAYPESAKVETWKRSYSLAPVGGLTIEDDFVLKEAGVPNQINFLVWQKPDISQPGTVSLNVGGEVLRMKYDPALFTASTESIPQTDKRLSQVWGQEIYRVALKAKKVSKKGKYQFVITKQG